MKPKILIATPLGSDDVKVKYMETVMGITTLFQKNSIPYTYKTITSSEIAMNRNILASYFYHKNEWTHLLFIDDDMSFAPKIIINMLNLNKDIIGIAATKRKLNILALYNAFLENAAAGKVPDVNALLSEVMEFNVTHHKEDIVQNVLGMKKGGIIDVAKVGTGIMMIKRDVFAKMIKSANLRQYRSKLGMKLSDNDQPVYGFFDAIYDEQKQDTLSEDFSFCQRWTEDCNGQIYAYVDEFISHHGDFEYGGNYSQNLQAKLRKIEKQG